MSLSKDPSRGGKPNVIKLHSLSDRIKILDYKSILEEIEADKKNEVKVDVDEIVGEENPSRGLVMERPAEYDIEDAAKKAITEAYEQGFEAGKAEVTRVLQAEYERKVQEVVAAFTSLVREFELEIERYDRDFDEAIVTLALAIARRVVAREIEIDEGAVLARSREAIRKIIGVEKIKIHVNPSDEEYIRGHRNELSAYADSVKEIVIEADNKVERGGCIIESELGNIDARVSTQFDIIEEALAGLIK